MNHFRLFLARVESGPAFSLIALLSGAGGGLCGAHQGFETAPLPFSGFLHFRKPERNSGGPRLMNGLSQACEAGSGGWKMCALP